MRIAIPVLEACSAFTPIGVLDLLSKAVDLHAGATGQRPDWELILVGDSPTVTTTYGLPIRCGATRETLARPDLVVVPALDGDVPSGLERNRAWAPWLCRMYDAGADMASSCTGSFLLAEAGILTGRRATTHWSAANLFRRMYPMTTLLEDRIIVDEGRVITGGGATALGNLVLYLVEKHLGVESSLLASRYFLVDADRRSQAAYAIFSSQKHHDDLAILKAQQIVEEHIGHLHAVESLAREVGLSRRNFLRRFKRATGNTFLEYQHRTKVEHVKRGLERDLTTFEILTQAVGYTNVPGFRRIFHRFTGLNPSEYKRKYSRTLSLA